jgi:hypothetical protein
LQLPHLSQTAPRTPGGAPSAISGATPRVPSRPGRSRCQSGFASASASGFPAPFRYIGDRRPGAGREPSAPRRPAAPSLPRARARISRSWQPDAGKSRWRPWPNPGLRTFRLVQHEWAETGMHVRYLWARHPAIAGGSVHHVHAVSSRATPSPPSRRQAARSPGAATRLATAPDTQKAFSSLGKGLYLRKLVAGAGFEPATSGL